jgi:hypothetical protein
MSGAVPTRRAPAPSWGTVFFALGLAAMAATTIGLSLLGESALPELPLAVAGAIALLVGLVAAARLARAGRAVVPRHRA